MICQLTLINYNCNKLTLFNTSTKNKNIIQNINLVDVFSIDFDKGTVCCLQSPVLLEHQTWEQ